LRGSEGRRRVYRRVTSIHGTTSIAVLILLLALAVLATPLAPQAQQPTKVPRIGLLGGGSASANAVRIDAFRQGLRELGYVEGKNIVIEELWAEGKADRLPVLVAELVRLKVDVIVSAGPTVTRAVKEAKVTTPVVMGFDDDPVGSGFVSSLARPGGNITGLSSFSPGLNAKQLELLKEIIPRLSRVAVLGSLIHPGTTQSLQEMELAARAFKVQLQYLDVVDLKHIETAFGVARKERVDALLVLTSIATNLHRRQIVDLAVKNRLPAIYFTTEWVEAGGLLTYGASYTDLLHRAATYVDKILKGAKPADLPVEQPTKFELAINLRTARALGLTIPQSLLLRADQVIQ
jgi:putative ABC transport system substrate-binding protein